MKKYIGIIVLLLIVILTVFHGNTIFASESIKQEEQGVKYSGIVFEDKNSNGIQDNDEKGRSEVEVSLLKSYKETSFDEDTIIIEYETVEIAITDNNGEYSFTLQNEEGKYKVGIKDADITNNYLVSTSVDKNDKNKILFLLQRKEQQKRATLEELIKNSVVSEEDSLTKIKYAFENKYIDYKTKVEYDILAFLGKDTLPKEFSSQKKISSLENLGDIYKFIADNKTNIFYAAVIDELVTQIQLRTLLAYDDYKETNNFRIFYITDPQSDHVLLDGVSDGDSNGYPDKVDQIGGWLEASYNKITGSTANGDYGFNVPLVPSTTDGLIEVFINTLNDEEVHGSVNCVEAFTSVPYTYAGQMTLSSYITADGYTNTLQRVIAHEMTHLSLISYNENTDLWFQEATADYIANKYLSSISTVINSYKEYLNNPEISLDYDSGNFMYGTSLFLFHIDQNYGGITTIRDIWERLGTANQNYNDAFTEINYIISNNNSSESLDSVFKEFTFMNYDLTNYNIYSTSWAISHSKFISTYTYPDYYDEGTSYMACNYYAFLPPTTTETYQLGINYEGVGSSSGGFILFKEGTNGYTTTNYAISNPNNDIEIICSNFNVNNSPIVMDVYNTDWSGLSTIDYTIKYHTCTLSSWYTPQPPTCTVDGYRQRHCTNISCSYIEQETLPATGHTWPSSWATTSSPTCTSTGTEVKRCTSCNTLLDSRTVSALGHNPGAAATCTTAQTCTRCGTTLASALGHTAGVAATCTTAQTCIRCSYVYQSALGHSYTGTQTVIYPPTCTLSGKTKVYCCRCSAYTYIYPAATGHDWGSLETYATYLNSSTCPYRETVRDYCCDNCYVWKGTQTTSYTYVGHSYGAWIFQYTYYDYEEMTYVNVYKRTCSRCGHYEYDYI